MERGAATRVPLSRIRRVTAKVMSASAVVPQFVIEREVSAGRILGLRRQLKAAGGSVTNSDFLTAACAHALRAHSGVNASFDSDAVVRHEVINIGLAMALDDGLVVPCIGHANRQSLEALAACRMRLGASARAGTLTPAEVLDTTFTISNLGPLGVKRFRALVVPPQVAILAVGAIGPGVIEGPDGFELAPTLSLSLSCDHRVLDGAPAARFLADVAARLERPDWMVAL